MATTTAKKSSFDNNDIQINSNVPFNPQAPFFKKKKDRTEKILAESIQINSAFAKRIEKEQGTLMYDYFTYIDNAVQNKPGS